MSPKPTKLLLVPIDGNKTALSTLNYINLMFGPDHDLKVALLYVLPALPPILIEESRRNRETAVQVKALQTKNHEMAAQILAEAQGNLTGMGFQKDRIITIRLEQAHGIAQDICAHAESRQADAIALSTRGRSRLEAFLMGETANKVLERSHICPVWLIKGKIAQPDVLIGIDHSQNALRAVDHVGFMLGGSDCRITLFHTQRSLSRFLPKQLLEAAPGLESVWRKTDATDIMPVMEKAQTILHQAGIPASRINVKMLAGSRNPARDILSAAEKANCGTIVMGRQGASADQYTLGIVTRKVIESIRNTAVWVI